MAKQVKFDAVVFDDSIKRLARVYGKSKKAVADQQAGLILKDCIRFTPPYRGGNFKEESGSRFQIGKNSIINAVDRIFRSIESFSFANQMTDFSIRMMKYLREGRYESARHMLLDKTGKVFHFAAKPDRKWHFNNINKWGRSRKSQGVVWIGQPSAMKVYYQKLFSRVMRGVGGWSTSAKELGVSMPSKASKAAKWRGDAVRKRTDYNYSITCSNDVPYLNRTERVAQITQRALNNRMRKIRLELRAASRAVAEKMNQALKTGRIPTERQVAEALKHVSTENPF